MGFTQAFKLAFKSLSGSKMRAFLTMMCIRDSQNDDLLGGRVDNTQFN